VTGVLAGIFDLEQDPGGGSRSQEISGLHGWAQCNSLKRVIMMLFVGIQSPFPIVEPWDQTSTFGDTLKRSMAHGVTSIGGRRSPLLK